MKMKRRYFELLTHERTKSWKPRVVDFYDNTFDAKMAFLKKRKYLNFNH